MDMAVSWPPMASLARATLRLMSQPGNSVPALASRADLTGSAASDEWGFTT